mgnify:CR=1 FL=1
MKIAFTNNILKDTLNFRGNVIKAFLNKGHKVTVICPNEKNINVKNFDERLNFIPVEVSRKGKNPFSDLIYCKKLFDVYKKEKFDLIFHYTIKPNIYGNIASHFAKIKSISIIPGLGHLFIKESFSTKIVEVLYRFSLNYANEVWFLNEDDKKEFLKRKLVKESKIKILPGEGINLEKFKPIKVKRNDNKVIFLMIARVLWEKGFKEYVEAAEILKKKYSNLEFQLLGGIDTGNPSGVPKEIVIKYHNNKTINYLGTTNDVPSVIAKCDCLVLPSYREGVPRTLMEGASMEKPLIATNVTGCREIVIDNYDGFLCEVKNSKDLADKVEKFLLLSKEEREKLGKNGRKLMKEKFEDSKVIEKYYKVIKEKI